MSFGFSVSKLVKVQDLSGMSSSQTRLIEIMNMVKNNEITMEQMEYMFKDWQGQYKGGKTGSFKEKEVSIVASMMGSRHYRSRERTSIACLMGGRCFTIGGGTSMAPLMGSRCCICGGGTNVASIRVGVVFQGKGPVWLP